MITSKKWPLEHQQGFPLIWPGDLVSDIKWPSFKLDLEIIKTNILSNIYDDYLNKKSTESNVAPAGIKSYKFLFVLKKIYFAVFKKLTG